MCKWFFKDDTKIQNGCQKQKPQNLTSEIIQILQSHPTQYGDAQVIFLRLQKLKS